VTLPTVSFLDSVGGRGQPRALRPMFRELRWAAIDLQPRWAQRLLRFSPGAAAPLRRAAVWTALNGMRYGAGPLREVTSARARVAAAAAPADRSVELVS